MLNFQFSFSNFAGIMWGSQGPNSAGERAERRCRQGDQLSSAKPSEAQSAGPHDSAVKEKPSAYDSAEGKRDSAAAD